VAAESGANDRADGGGMVQPRSQKIKWTDIITATAAAIALVASGAAVYYAHDQVSVSKQQNLAAEQNQLVSLVVAIAQFSESSNQSVYAGIATRNEEVVDGQEAAAIIGVLPSGDVSATEYVQVGKALEDAGDYALANTYFNKVTFSPQTPDTFANAMRNDAILWYDLADDKYLSEATRLSDEKTAASATTRAADAYNRSQYVDLYDKVESIALTYLDVAPVSSCQAAQIYMNNAYDVLKEDPSVINDSQIEAQLKLDLADLKNQC
jgi:hypothetical protein